MSADKDKIDFVLPWVDGSDLEWQNKKKKYESDHSNLKNESTGNSIFRDMNTLKYVLRSIEKNCPWYNKIYIITEGHIPDWLDINNKKIVHVTHDNLYFDKSNLPIYSSSSIEMNLANIKGLADKLVYLNDDTIIWSFLSKERFFKEDKAVDFLAHGWLPRNKIFKKFRGMNVWAHSLRNNLDLINRENNPLTLKRDKLYHPSYSLLNKISNLLAAKVYHSFFWIEHWHHPQPYTKKTLENVYSIYKSEMMESSKNRFRSATDLTAYIYRYWHLLKGDFYPYKHNDAMHIQLSSLHKVDQLQQEISTRNINFICFNDTVHLSDDEFILVKHSVDKMLSQRFSSKASFEK